MPFSHFDCRRAGNRGRSADAPSDQENLSLLAPDALKARGFVHLPQSLPEALDRFAANPKTAEWFSSEFAYVYRKHKQGEIAFLNGRDQAEICETYEEVY
jgi:glutamine synthetase